MLPRVPRLLFFDGPGNLVGSFRSWREREPYSGELALTYSAQLFNVAERLGLQTHAVAWPRTRERVVDGDFVVEHRPAPFASARGALFHAAQAAWAADLLALAARFRPDVTMLVDTPYPFLFAPLRGMGTRVVVALHNTLWPANHRRTGVAQRMLSRANGWFFRNHVDVTLALSPECERQVRTVAGDLRGPIVQYRPQFEAHIAPAPRTPPGVPFKVLFASRVERNKGVLDVIEAAARLEARRPGRFAWVICGGGSAEREVAHTISARGLTSVIRQRPQLRRVDLLEEYANCDAVIVPTTATFAEGMAKVALEGALAGRPVIVSETVPAGEVLGDAAITVLAGDISGYVQAVERLADNAALYLSMCSAADRVSKILLNRDHGFEAIVERTLRRILSLPQVTGASSSED